MTVSASSIGSLTGKVDSGPYPFLWIDALVLKVREGGRVVNTSALVATAVNAAGRREIVGLDLGSAETGSSWTQFLRGLVGTLAQHLALLGDVPRLSSTSVQSSGRTPEAVTGRW